MEPRHKTTPGGDELPPIPAKRYFTIGEVSELCGVKPHVLRYWEQEFNQLKPVKRRGNRRYYQHHEVLLVRRIRELLYNQVLLSVAQEIVSMKAALLTLLRSVLRRVRICRVACVGSCN
jgi:DNA-binding transcriptional MerR regulator